MTQPINYINPNLGPIKPQQGLFDAYQDVQLMKQQRADQAIKNQAIATQQARKVAFDTDFDAMGGDFNTGNIAKLMLKYPEYAEKYQKPWENFKAVEREQNLNNLKMVNSAVENGRVDVAIERLNDHATRYENAGNSQMAQVYSQAAEDMASNKDNAVITLRSLMLGADKEALDSYLGTQKLGGELGKTAAETEKLKIETDEIGTSIKEKEQDISQKDLGFATDLDTKKLQNKKVMQDLAIDQAKMRELPPEVKKANTARIQEMKKTVSDFNQADNLLKEIPNFEGGTIEEKQRAVAQFFTGGTKRDAWLQRFEKFKLVDMLNNKPPGAMSEGELSVLQKGVPPAGASSEVITDYLETAIKGLQYSYAYDRLAVKFSEQNKGTGSAMEDFEILGEKVNKGESLDEFMNRLGEDSLKYGLQMSDRKKVSSNSKPGVQGQKGRQRKAPQQIPAAIQTRSYMNLQAP